MSQDVLRPAHLADQPSGPTPAGDSDALARVSYVDAARDPDAFARALGRSFEATGFAIVCDHPIPADLIGRVQDQARRFFAQPLAVKQAGCRPELAGARGYTPPGVETAKDAAHPDLKEFWHVGRALPAGHRYAAYMPANVAAPGAPDLAPAAQSLFDAFDAVGGVLLSAVARHLGVAPDFFEEPTRDGNSVLRLLHYPPVATGAVGERAGAHEDINLLTLLLGADEDGLEARTPQGQWIAVRPQPGELVVNIADMLQRLTNGRLPSTTHRVVNPSPERAGVSRFSLPFFLHFAPDYWIETLPSCVTPERPNAYGPPITADAYLRERLEEIGLAQGPAARQT